MRSLSTEHVELIVAGSAPDFDATISTFTRLALDLIAGLD